MFCVQIIPRDRSYSSAIPACTGSALDWTILRLYTSLNSIVVATEPEKHIQIRERRVKWGDVKSSARAPLSYILLSNDGQTLRLNDVTLRHGAISLASIWLNHYMSAHDEHNAYSRTLCNFVDVVATQENQQHISTQRILRKNKLLPLEQTGNVTWAKEHRAFSLYFATYLDIISGRSLCNGIVPKNQYKQRPHTFVSVLSKMLLECPYISKAEWKIHKKKWQPCFSYR